mmetsp:Transcript_16054/g.66123  ORF Transcript_16054/g.66123 Transcript_16054/m.66123 type:complete len:464 (-) Transcript_16054:561-1952(-)|eukprot:CAMPEP_0113955956 /NCGR_PEP_ID=MMETSP0011_2-20120614/1746_1 /TAXON_ID=101924 /ORGANISM="Rhodosorus marinus" /LENGTH=463 /DNA_ID=CAMNT_0000965953 /DNA_START=221 /DNA_END=1612 /DNA_ORIENTATION=- /assembly_acc=CAM_ASM_000156
MASGVTYGKRNPLPHRLDYETSLEFDRALGQQNPLHSAELDLDLSQFGGILCANNTSVQVVTGNLPLTSTASNGIQQPEPPLVKHKCRSKPNQPSAVRKLYVQEFEEAVDTVKSGSDSLSGNDVQELVNVIWESLIGMQFQVESISCEEAFQTLLGLSLKFANWDDCARPAAVACVLRASVDGTQPPMQIPEAIWTTLVDRSVSSLSLPPRTLLREIASLFETCSRSTGSCPAAKSVEHIFHNVVAFELKDSLSRRADFHARGGTRAILNNLGEASPLNLFHWCTLHAPAQEEAAKESKDIARMFTELTSCPTTDQDELEWLLRIAMNITHGRPKPSATFTRLGAARACIRLLDQRFQQDVITLALGLLVSLNYYSMVEFSIEDMKMVLRSMIKGGPAAGYGAILLGLAYGNQPELYEQLNIPSRKANAEVVQEFQGFLRDNRILTEGMAKICERAENNLQRD